MYDAELIWVYLDFGNLLYNQYFLDYFFECGNYRFFDIFPYYNAITQTFLFIL